MKIVIDTTSILSLVRYYLPFDKNLVLFNFIKSKIEEGEIIVIDKVLEQCKYVSAGIICKKIEYFLDKTFQKKHKFPYNTELIIAPAPAKFLRQVDGQFVNVAVKNSRKLSEIEYQNQKDTFLEDADMKLIILCLNLLKNDPEEEIILVTEETENSNDNKLFKKIPAICACLNIKTMNLPEFLKLYREVELKFSSGNSGDALIFIPV